MPRPKEFDPDQVLEKAMMAFWEKGYQATTVQDLVDRMGINRFSLYDTFGSKHELFLSSLDRYFDGVVLKRLAELEDSGAGTAAIRHFFDGWVELLSSAKGRRGCFLINSAVELAPHDGATRAKIKGDVERLKRAFQSALLRAQEKGELRSGTSPEVLATVLTGHVQGLSVLAKAGLPKGAMQRSCDALLSLLA